jgi:hypothetical protein
MSLFPLCVSKKKLINLNQKIPKKKQKKKQKKKKKNQKKKFNK